MPIVLIVALLLGGGISAAAQSSVPGDALYPVKINVNEGVEAFFAFSAEGKARADAERINERLEEAEELAAENRLDAQARASIEERLNVEAKKFDAEVEKLKAEARTQAAAEVSSELEGSLNGHGAVIRKLIAQNHSVDALVVLNGRVDLMLGEIMRHRADTEAHVAGEAGVQADVRTAAEGKMKAAENKIAEVKRKFDRIKADLTAEAKADIQARIEAAESAMVSGKAQLAADAFTEAFSLFQKAHRLAQEAQILITANIDLELGLLVRNDRDDRRDEDSDQDEDRDEDNDADEDKDEDVDDDNDRNRGNDDDADVDVEVDADLNVNAGGSGVSGSGSGSGNVNLNL